MLLQTDHAADYLAWSEMVQDFYSERGAPPHDTLMLQQRFSKGLERQCEWGFFDEKNLIAIGTYTAQFKKVVQIGTVYTIPSRRNRGIATQLMQKIIMDSQNLHRLKKLVLFNGEQNLAAQKVYERLGFKRIGFFGLIYWWAIHVDIFAIKLE